MGILVRSDPDPSSRLSERTLSNRRLYTAANPCYPVAHKVVNPKCYIPTIQNASLERMSRPPSKDCPNTPAYSGIRNRDTDLRPLSTRQISRVLRDIATIRLIKHQQRVATAQIRNRGDAEMRARERWLAGNRKVVVGHEGGVFCSPGDVVAVYHAGRAILGVEVVCVAQACCWVDVRDGDRSWE